MRFTKSHGAGNDFVLLKDLDDDWTPTRAFVSAVCDRHTGVGADGIIRIAPASGADFFMDYYNANGDAAEMCGNGIRCLAKYVADRGLHAGDELRVDTRAGVKHLAIVDRAPDGSVDRVRVDMGPPILDRARIPMGGEGDPLHEKIESGGYAFEAACVSMGNPHCILFLDDDVPFEQLGPAIETMEVFSAGTNVEFTRVLNDREVRVRVWERGVGETQACGTGACATAVAAHLRGFTGREVAVHLPGGTLDIVWTDETVLMTGPARETFEGDLAPGLVALLKE
jgi:diaminopimelate epimerase